MITYLKNNNGLVVTDTWEPGCWINIEQPSPEEKKYLEEQLQIPISFYNDVEDVDERPRIEQEEDWMLIIMRVPIRNNDVKLPYSTIPIGILFKEEVFITISFYKTEMVADFIEYSKRKKIIKEANFDFVLRFLVSTSVWFLKYLKQINQKIKLAEYQLENSIRNEDLQTLLQLEKCLVFFTTSLKGNDILLRKIKNLREYKSTFDPELLEDVDIETKQAQEMANIYSDILSGMMDAYASVISNNLNVIMKQLTSISIILMIPTVIASFYGMNVPNPFENRAWGFWFVFVISFVFALSGVLLFKRKKWF